jgi:hypothetical protein
LEYGALRLQDGHDRRPVDTAVEPLVTRTIEAVTGVVAAAIGDPLGRETIAVQLLPKDAVRRIDKPDPGNCHF